MTLPETEFQERSLTKRVKEEAARLGKAVVETLPPDLFNAIVIFQDERTEEKFAVAFPSFPGKSAAALEVTEDQIKFLSKTGDTVGGIADRFAECNPGAVFICDPTVAKELGIQHHFPKMVDQHQIEREKGPLRVFTVASER